MNVEFTDDEKRVAASIWMRRALAAEAEVEQMKRALVDRENIIRAVLRRDEIGGALEERMIAAVGTWGADETLDSGSGGETP